VRSTPGYFDRLISKRSFGFFRSITCPDLSTSSRVNAFANWFVERTCPEAREGSKDRRVVLKVKLQDSFLCVRLWRNRSHETKNKRLVTQERRSRNLTQPFDTPVLLTQNGTQGEREG